MGAITEERVLKVIHRPQNKINQLKRLLIKSSLFVNVYMSKAELKAELKKVNTAIDKKILEGKGYPEYKDLAERHKRIINLLKQ